MKKLIPIILIIALSGCAVGGKSSNDMNERMKSVHIGMTRRDVENLIGKPNFVTTQDTVSGRMEICDYTFDTVNDTQPGEIPLWRY